MHREDLGSLECSGFGESKELQDIAHPLSGKVGPKHQTLEHQEALSLLHVLNGQDAGMAAPPSSTKT